MDTILLALRVVVALGAVFGALFVAHRWITKGRPGAPAKAKHIAIVSRQGLGAKAGIALVEAGGRRYLLGVTEHTVTVLDTFGAAADADGATVLPALVEGQPVTAVRFEQELRTVTIATGDLPVLTAGPTTPVTLSIPAPAPVVPLSRREARQAEQRRAQSGPLAGSVLSPATWRQTFDAIKQVR